MRRGERGTTVVFWQLRKARAPPRPIRTRQRRPARRVVPLLRAYTVFNVAQVDGVPAATAGSGAGDWEPEAQAEGLLLISGATDSARRLQGATTSPATMRSSCRRGRRFPTAGSYYATALHELAHWTAQPRRCNRDLGRRFGDDAYAAEELIAEMGAAFLCAHCRIDGSCSTPAMSSLAAGPARRQARDLRRSDPGPAGGGLRPRLLQPSAGRKPPWPPEPTAVHTERPRLIPVAVRHFTPKGATHDRRQTIKRALTILAARIRTHRAGVTQRRARLPDGCCCTTASTKSSSACSSTARTA